MEKRIEILVNSEEAADFVLNVLMSELFKISLQSSCDGQINGILVVDAGAGVPEEEVKDGSNT